jgi:hypothetical protein
VVAHTGQGGLHVRTRRFTHDASRWPRRCMLERTVLAVVAQGVEDGEQVVDETWRS